MSQEEKQQLKEIIIKKIGKAEKKVAQMESMSQPISPENSIGRISRMDAIGQKGVMEAALRNAKAELSNLIAAQQSLDDPKYGYCLKCGEEIQIKRLFLLPGSKYCLRCSR